jgi:predicted nucleic acid-binding protein
LLEYEIWTRIHARKLTHSHSEEVRSLLSRVALVELSPAVLARALEPSPKPVRTLDALHVASIDFLRKHGQIVRLASYDTRLAAAARAVRIPLYKL